MDPFSLAGLAFGAASLAFELFSGCIKGYNLLIDAHDMPEAYNHLRVRLQMEKDKLIGWAVLAKISDNESLAPTLLLSRQSITDVLNEMQRLLLDVDGLGSRYGLHLTIAADSTNGSSMLQQHTVASPKNYNIVEKKAIDLFDRTRKCHKRLKWATFDKVKFEELLTNLGSMNSNMMQFLEYHDRKQHAKMQEATFLQILEVNTKVDDLRGLLQSFQANGDNPGPLSSRPYTERAIRLTQFKTTCLAIENGDDHRDGQAAAKDPKLSMDNLELQPRDENQTRSCGTLDNQPIWVDWRDYEPLIAEDDDEDEDQGNRPPPTIETRIRQMAQLLGDTGKPIEFRVPDCLGYVNDGRATQLGFVFALSSSPNSRQPQKPPISLFDLLCSTSSGKPSLTSRIRAAQQLSSSIMYLHSTNWLHKGLRSENVVFEGGLSSPPSDVIRKGSLRLCGFDYARPAETDETTTEKPRQNLWHDLYRHPRAQFEVPREAPKRGHRGGFRRIYDIYSLGIILFELGMWRPLYDILGLERLYHHAGEEVNRHEGSGKSSRKVERLKASTVKEVRGKLLGADKLDELAGEAGDAFAGVVRACLSGDFGLEKGEEDDGLQVAFWEKVVAKLEEIQV